MIATIMTAARTPQARYRNHCGANRHRFFICAQIAAPPNNAPAQARAAPARRSSTATSLPRNGSTGPWRTCTQQMKRWTSTTPSDEGSTTSNSPRARPLEKPSGVEAGPHRGMVELWGRLVDRSECSWQECVAVNGHDFIHLFQIGSVPSGAHLDQPVHPIARRARDGLPVRRVATC